jgi:hypothetical protein
MKIIKPRVEILACTPDAELLIERWPNAFWWPS